MAPTVLGYLVNSVTINVPGQGSTLLKAGYACIDAVTQAAILAAGGLLATATDAAILNAVAIVVKQRARGANEDLLNSIMMSAFTSAVQTDDPQLLSLPQAQSTISLAEVYLFSLGGTGTIKGAWYVPTATSTPGAGSNSQALLLTLYTDQGVSVGSMASATLANATPMATKWVRYALTLGAAANLAYKDGYFVTAQSTLTGTATLPAGTWVVEAIAN